MDKLRNISDLCKLIGLVDSKTKKPLNSVKTAKAIKPSPPLYLTMFNCFAFSALPPSKKNAIAAK